MGEGSANGKPFLADIADILMSERSTLSRRTEEECRPLLLSMFRVLKELLLYCEEHSRADLAEEVAEALSMCQADFTNLKERLNAGRVDRVGVDVQRSTLSLSPLACHTVGPVDSSPLPDPPDSPSSNSHMLSQLVETLDIEQLQARRHPSAPTPPPPSSPPPRPCCTQSAPLHRTCTCTHPCSQGSRVQPPLHHHHHHYHHHHHHHHHRKRRATSARQGRRR
jgi:hypothetical protein